MISGGSRGAGGTAPPPLSHGLNDQVPPLPQDLDPELNVYHV